MDEYQKIEKEIKIKQEWLKERDGLKQAIKVTKSALGVYCHVDVSYVYGEGSGWKYTARLSTKTSEKLLEILEKELREFDSKGYEGWLKEREQNEKV